MQAKPPASAAPSGSKSGAEPRSGAPFAGREDRDAAPRESFERFSTAPWIVCSLLAHLLALAVLSSIAGRERPVGRAPLVTAWRAPLELEELDPAEPPELPDPEADALELLEDVELIERVVSPELVEEPDGDAYLDDGGALAVAGPFHADGANDFTGLLGGAAGKLGARRQGAASYAGSAGMSRALADGLDWLARHQADDGRWDCDGFARRGAGGECGCGGPGQRDHDVGVTALALLAFLGAGSSTAEGPHRDAVARGVRWLREQQDPETGRIADPSDWSAMYGHALATMALCEAYHATKSPLLLPSCADAVHFIQRARNPYGAWRYQSPPNGESDTSVTGWMVFALATAADAGLELDPGALDAALAWIDRATDPRSGRVGYIVPGDTRGRGHGEAMTAVGLLCRIFLADLGRESDPEILEAHAELLLRDLPRWSSRGDEVDTYYWYYGTYAMYQLGGDAWARWERALEDAVVRTQERTGHQSGSWDPIGAWSGEGGRVYSTALLTMCLEVYFRYERVLGGALSFYFQGCARSAQIHGSRSSGAEGAAPPVRRRGGGGRVSRLVRGRVRLPRQQVLSAGAVALRWVAGESPR